jgi:hypothetical protein
MIFLDIKTGRGERGARQKTRTVIRVSVNARRFGRAISIAARQSGAGDFDG